jgi:hypothetical protein
MFESWEFSLIVGNDRFERASVWLDVMAHEKSTTRRIPAISNGGNRGGNHHAGE